MKAKAEKRERTTLAVYKEFGRTVATLARASGLTVADYCEQNLGGALASQWKALAAGRPKAAAKRGA